MYALYFHYQVLKANSHSQQCAHVWTWANLGGWKAVSGGRCQHHPQNWPGMSPSLNEIEKYCDCGSTWPWNSLGYIVCARIFPGCFHGEPSHGAPRDQRRHPMLEPPWSKGLEQVETFSVLKLILRVFSSLWFLRELFHREFQALYEGKLFNLWFLT